MSMIARSIRPFTIVNRFYTTAAASESIVARLKNDRKTFMKEKKQPDLNVLKGLLSDFTYYTKSPSFKEGTSEDEAMMSVLQKAIKRRQDSIEQFKSEQMSAEAIEKEVKSLIEQLGATSAKDMGKVMKAWKYDSAVADRKLVSDAVKKCCEM